MKKIFYLTGKSASGKDSIYRMLLDTKGLSLSPIVIYTTRPKREGEVEGREYHFVDETAYRDLEDRGEGIECRTYDTVHGPWRYFTVKTGIGSLRDYLLGIGTLESFIKVKEHFGPDVVIPIYIRVDDGDRLIRAINREKESNNPDYREMCRRFLADDEDFSEEKLREAGITEQNTFDNDDLSICIDSIRSMISGYQSQQS